jgi:site-specific DNA-cytosine methylase
LIHLRERQVAFKDVHFFCGSGGGGIGFARSHARVGRTTAKFESLGGIDVDPIACADFEQNVGAPAYPLDMFTLEQFRGFHRQCKTSRKKCRVCSNTGQPHPGWKELTGPALLRLFGYQFPDAIFFSAPCKGLSALLNPKTAAGERYQSLNQLVVRGIQLAMDAWGESPPGLIIMENVPRIATRGRVLLTQVTELLQSHGYAVRETEHDCGEIGNLGQRRRRFLLVARHKEKIKPFLYEPPKHSVRGVGEIIGGLPLPGTDEGGPLHQLPRLQWITWLRLALIEAGKDWRHLHQLELEDREGPDGSMNKYLKNIGIEPLREWHRGVRGIRKWDEPVGTVTGSASPTTGAFSVADPRNQGTWGGASKYKVTPFNEPTGTVIGESSTGTGAYAVQDPRTKDYGKFCSLGIQPLTKPSPTVTGQSAPGTGFYSIPDPRLACDAEDKQKRRFNNVYRLVRWDQPAQAVTTGVTPSSGGQAVADPRPAWSMKKSSFVTGGHLGIIPWDKPAGTISAHAKIDRGKFAVADPRDLPAPRENCLPLIISLEGYWNRPLTLLELASLQGYPLTSVFHGTKTQIREHIGNSVPPPAGESVGNLMLETLLRAKLEVSTQLDQRAIWVQDSLAPILSFADPDEMKSGLS